MSSPAASDRDPYARRIPPASRLIPGLAFPPAGIPRKKPQSVTWDLRHWVEDERPESNPAPNPPTIMTALRQAILPTPAESRDRYWLLTAIAADFLLATICLKLVATVLRSWGMGSASRLSLILLYGALLTLLGYSEGLYRADTPWEMETIILGKVLAWTTILTAGVLCNQNGMAVYEASASAPVLYFGLVGWRSWKRKRALSRAGRNVLIVGAGRAGRELAAHLNDHCGRRTVCGFLDDEEPLSGNVLGRSADLARVARAEFADEIILVGVPAEVARRVILEAHRNRLDVRIVPDVFGLPMHPAALERYGETPLLTIHEEPIPGMCLSVKRAADVLLSVLMLTISAPLLAGIGLLIKLDSAGPVLYRAPRIGKKGRQFLCFKFRTMVADADQSKERLRAENERQGAFFKIAGDPRITRLGRFLRRYSLDELPQLMNVLKGEMSLVGPRPHPMDDCARYQLADLRRLDVVPGLTGLWQVTARSDPSFERNMALDLEYIERWNLWMDLKILCRTAWVVVQGNGA
jgi:exopolysaccharide biosynthesis polyprenyl glycosylphosphotransferase